MEHKTLNEMHVEANKLIEAIRLADGHLKEYLTADLYNLVDTLTRYNCAKVLRKYNIYSIDAQEAYEIAVNDSFLYAVQNYDASKNIHFLTYLERVVEWVLQKQFQKAKAKKREGASNVATLDDVDNPVNESEIVNNPYAGSDQLVVDKLEFERLQNEFVKAHKFGAVVLFENVDRDARTAGILKVLGATEYGQKERKQVERVKKAFKEFLRANGFDYYM